ncbi:hypothetical protein QE392_001068 [Microbacterium proteolyticum]|nr:hypothetical protein [Microbacterium sp. SORGH_AS_0344]MDQ1169264.1 hypothetical protein [Microbacterium proteolyticum]
MEAKCIETAATLFLMEMGDSMRLQESMSAYVKTFSRAV